MQLRPVRYETLDDVTADAQRLLETGYVAHGNWTLGQSCAHLAQTIEYAIDGFPFRLPAPVRLVIRVIGLKRRMFRTRTIRRGLKAPQALTPPATDDAQGVDQLNKAVKRFAAFPGPLHPSPVLGRLTRDEWVRFHTIHAEHHLSLLHPTDAV